MYQKHTTFSIALAEFCCNSWVVKAVLMLYLALYLHVYWYFQQLPSRFYMKKQKMWKTSLELTHLEQPWRTSIVLMCLTTLQFAYMCAFFLSAPCKALSQHCVQTWGRTLQRQHNLVVIMQEAAAGPCVQRAVGHTCKRPMLYSAGRDSEIKFICVSKSHNKHFTAPQKPLVTCVHNPDTPESLHPEPIRRRAS